MNNQGAIQCKVKLVTDGEQQEMRRFQLDDSSFASNFDLFKEKLRAVFPQLRDTGFKVTWTDGEGDVITIANDEDLLMAMMEMNGLKVLQVHISGETKEDTEEDNIPFNMYGSVITCDVCNCRITRYRYKCLQCHDYDLCQNCEQAGNHSQHAMMRLVNLEIPRGLHKMVSHCTRAARKAAHHAAREAHHAARGAHRAARCGFDMARSAARGEPGRCSFRHNRHDERKPGPAEQAAEIPVFDTTVLYDLASSFLGPFTQAHGGATNNGPAAAQPQQPTQTPNQGATPTQASGTATPTPNAAPTPAAAPVDVIGNILRDVFSAINANVAQAASGASTPVPTPAPTPTNTPAAPGTRDDDVVIVDPTPTTKATTNSTPMDVEQPAQATQTAPIYPNVPQGPDAGWTFVSPPVTTTTTAAQPSAPIGFAPPLNPDEVKYARQLGQLRRMGFSDNIDLVSLLKRYNGNIGLVVNHLFENSN